HAVPSDWENRKTHTMTKPRRDPPGPAQVRCGDPSPSGFLDGFLGAAQTLATVGQVRAHRGARSIRILAHDRVVDVFVLEVNAAQVAFPIALGQRGGVHPRTGNDGFAELLEDIVEIAVAGCR